VSKLIQADQDDVPLDCARIWQAADKIVYSRTLREATTARTRIEHDLDPVAVRRLKGEGRRVGGGKHWLPRGLTLRLEHVDERHFTSGVVYLRYRLTLDS
jgi:hypothetical protein